MAAKRPLTDEEIQIMINKGFAGKEHLRNRAMFCFGIATGYRIQEILHHKVRDVVVKKKVKEYVEIPKRFRKAKVSGQTKKLVSFARKALQSHIDNEFKRAGAQVYGEIFDQYLFPSRKVDPKTGIYKPISVTWAWEIFDKAYRRCNIEGAVSTHSMRKTFAQKMYKKAVEEFREGRSDIQPLRIVQKHLGHVNIDSTLKYLSFLTLDLDEEQFQFEINNDEDPEE